MRTSGPEVVNLGYPTEAKELMEPTPLKPIPDSSGAFKLAFFGPLILLSTSLLSLALARAGTLEYAIGYTVGKLLISIALASPLLLIFRFASKRWRSSEAVELFNLFCILASAVWIVQIALFALLPRLVPSLNADHMTSAPVTAAQPYGRNPDGSVRWQDFEPRNPADAGKVGAGAESQDADKSKWPVCKGAFDDLIPNAKCRARDK
jgi:hypothetical protein